MPQAGGAVALLKRMECCDTIFVQQQWHITFNRTEQNSYL